MRLLLFPLLSSMERARSVALSDRSGSWQGQENQRLVEAGCHILRSIVHQRRGQNEPSLFPIPTLARLRRRRGLLAPSSTLGDKEYNSLHQGGVPLFGGLIEDKR